MNKELRIGIVGCGGVARGHLRGYQSIKGAKVVSVYDISAESEKKFAGEAGARVAASPAQMAADDALDAVSICTPPASHWQCAKPFLAAHVPLYCEKPLELNAAVAARFAADVKKSRTLFMMGFNHRFYAPIIELKKLILWNAGQAPPLPQHFRRLARAERRPPRGSEALWRRLSH
jgi:myo-inositol 2-dehydrogenase/D-chiro-inositol 1-dehydrogenase